MKTKTKQIIRSIIYLFVAIISIQTFISCDAEKDFAKESAKIEKRNQEISFNEFKRQTGLINFDTHIRVSTNLSNSMARNADGTYELSDFDIETEVIKRLIIDDKTTYTFRIFPSIVLTTNSIYNLMVYKQDDQWVQSIVEYIPTLGNLDSILSGNSDMSSGTMGLLYVSNYDNLVQNNACFKIEVVSQHCNNSGTCDSEQCDGCIGTSGCLEKQYSSFCFDGNSITLGEQEDLVNVFYNTELDTSTVKNSVLININQIKKNTLSFVETRLSLVTQIYNIIENTPNFDMSNFSYSESNLPTDENEILTALTNCGISDSEEFLQLVKELRENSEDYLDQNKDFISLGDTTQDLVINEAIDQKFAEPGNVTQNTNCFGTYNSSVYKCKRNFLWSSGVALALSFTGIGGVIAEIGAIGVFKFCLDDAKEALSLCMN